MNSNLFSFYSIIFGFVVGGISLLGFFVAICRPHLPSNKIKTLEILLHETENIFRESVEAGLLIHEFIERTEHRLTVLKEHTCSLRACAYSATTLRRDCMELFRGTSKAIGHACQSIKNLRAEVVTSSEERRRLMHMHSEQSPPAPPPNLMTQHLPVSTPAIVPRPRSCPPALSVWSSDSVRNVPVESSGSHDQAWINGVSHPNGSFASDPLGNSSQSCSDVWTADVQP